MVKNLRNYLEGQLHKVVCLLTENKVANVAVLENVENLK